MTKLKLLRKTKVELLKIARRLGLRGISTMNKPDLADEITGARQKNNHLAAKPVAESKSKAKPVLKRRARRKTGAPTKLTVKPVIKRKTIVKVKSATSKSTRQPATKKPTAAAKPVLATAKPVASSAPVSVLAPGATKDEQLGDLPAAYGTGKLFLTARDPRWLYAYWDLSLAQMTDYAKRASDGKITLQVFAKGIRTPFREFAIHQGTRDSYISVNNPGATYHARLVIRRKNGSWQTISKSDEARTPPETIAESAPPRFVSIPVDVPYTELIEVARSYSMAGEGLAETLERLETQGFNMPFQVTLPMGAWSEQQTSDLERILAGDIMLRRQVGSAEVSEWLVRRLREQPGSAVFSAFRPVGASWSSPAGASWMRAPGKKGFWFAVNAELIIYGATEPDATVTIDGKKIQLRPDGTFAFHYIFPDGHYKLPVVAVSRDGDDRRAAELVFDRHTVEVGAVGKVRQPAHLKAPAAP